MKTWNTFAVLGAGGRNPRLDAWDAGTEVITTVATFSPGSSVYAIARSPDGQQIVAGTKSGSVTVWPWPDSGVTIVESAPRSWRLGHGHYPVRDLVFVTQRVVALLNQAGGCWLYDTETESGRGIPLDARGQTICALASVVDDILVGSATDGRLIFWNCSQHRVINEVKLPVTPARGYLAALHFWPAANALLLPSVSGDLVAVDVDTGKCQVRPAHERVWFLADCLGSRCLTFGHHDKLVRSWTKDLTSDGPLLKGGGSVIAGGVWEEEPSRLLLVHADGTAGIYTAEGTQIQLHAQLPEADYRTCVLPDAISLASHRDTESQTAAKNLIQEIQTHSHDAARKSQLLQQLGKLGYGHVALSLQVDQADEAQDLPTALRYSCELIGVLPWDQAASQHSLQRHLDLLERACLFAPAAEMLKRLGGTNRDIAAQRRPWMADQQTLTDPLATFEPDLPIPVLCDCATAIGTLFQGRWLTKRLRSYACPGIEISPKEFLAKLKQVHSERQWNLPPTSARTIPFVSRNGSAQHPSALIGGSAAGDGPAFDLCLTFEVAGGQTVVEPAVVFRVPGPEAEVSAADHNQRVRERFGQMRDQEGLRAHLRSLVETSVHALRRLLTAAAARRNQTRSR